MTDTYNQLKDELRVYYPGVTDDELTKMTDNLINFFVMGAKALYSIEKDFISLSDVGDTNLEETSFFLKKRCNRLKNHHICNKKSLD